ncbi:MAG: DsrE family protein [Marinicaulis sp.]|nr:DsrE family protein [Marinicaulis sp.]
MSRRLSIVLFAALLSVGSTAYAGQDAFTLGPVFEEFGPVAPVNVTWEIPNGTVLKHSFDTSDKAADGEVNRTLRSAARFVNMHVRAGVPFEDINVAVIIHGGAVHDVAKGEDNTTAPLVETLVRKGVQIIVCGQSAAYYDVATEDLLPGVDMALSAMTAHAVLQNEGYTVNPF